MKLQVNIFIIHNGKLVFLGYIRLEITVRSRCEVRSLKYGQGRRRTSSLLSILPSQDTSIYTSGSKRQMLWTGFTAGGNPSQNFGMKMLDSSQSSDGNTPGCAVRNFYHEHVGKRSFSPKVHECRIGKYILPLSHTS